MNERFRTLAWVLAAAAAGCGSEGGGNPACYGVQCVTPPANICVDGSTLRVYASTGRCEAGACTYGYQDVQCAGSACSQGACGQMDIGLVDHSDALPPDERSTTDVRLVDLDGDGDLDIVWVNQPAEDGSDGGLEITVNGGGTFTRGPIEALGSWSFACPVDVENDGDFDLVLSRPARTRAEVLLLVNDGSGGFSQHDGGVPLVTGGSHGLIFSRVAGGDVDRDGYVDLVAPISFNLDMTADMPNVLLMNNGDGTFRQDAAGRLPQVEAQADYTLSAAAGDVTGDGAPDIFLGEAERQMRLLVNDGSGFFTDETNGVEGGSPRLPADRLRAYRSEMVDIDGDGDLDIVVINDASTTSGEPVVIGNHLLLNDGFGYFSILQLPQTDEPRDSRGLAVADMDLDGNPDIVIGNDAATLPHGGTALEILLGDGRGFFTPLADVPAFGKGFFGVAAGDLDGDGLPDLACAVAMPDAGGSLSNVLLLSR